VRFGLEITREALELLMLEEFHPHLGARPLRQTIERHLQDAVGWGLFSMCSGVGQISFEAVNNSVQLMN
jgi:ATP-dependent Clp protease ATP-binding subunit ClpB